MLYIFKFLCGCVLAACFNLAYAGFHHPQEFLASIQGSKDEGKQIVHHFCAACHAEKPQINLGAPKIGRTDDWALRVKQGLDVLFAHTAEGYHAMPARGGCFECSDEQLKKAIAAMLPKNSKHDS